MVAVLTVYASVTWHIWGTIQCMPVIEMLKQKESTVYVLLKPNILVSAASVTWHIWGTICTVYAGDRNAQAERKYRLCSS